MSYNFLRNTRGLPWPMDHKEKVDEDLLDWLQTMFGFQKDNVSNQIEHLILLLANVHILQCPKPDQQPKVAYYSTGSATKATFVYGSLSSNMGTTLVPYLEASSVLYQANIIKDEKFLQSAAVQKTIMEQALKHLKQLRMRERGNWRILVLVGRASKICLKR